MSPKKHQFRKRSHQLAFAVGWASACSLSGCLNNPLRNDGTADTEKSSTQIADFENKTYTIKLEIVPGPLRFDPPELVRELTTNTFTGTEHFPAKLVTISSNRLSGTENEPVTHSIFETTSEDTFAPSELTLVAQASAQDAPKESDGQKLKPARRSPMNFLRGLTKKKSAPPEPLQAESYSSPGLHADLSRQRSTNQSGTSSLSSSVFDLDLKRDPVAETVAEAVRAQHQPVDPFGRAQITDQPTSGTDLRASHSPSPTSMNQSQPAPTSGQATISNQERTGFASVTGSQQSPVTPNSDWMAKSDIPNSANRNQSTGFQSTEFQPSPFQTPEEARLIRQQLANSSGTASTQTPTRPNRSATSTTASPTTATSPTEGFANVSQQDWRSTVKLDPQSSLAKTNPFAEASEYQPGGSPQANSITKGRTPQEIVKEYEFNHRQADAIESVNTRNVASTTVSEPHRLRIKALLSEAHSHVIRGELHAGYRSALLAERIAAENQIQFSANEEHPKDYSREIAAKIWQASKPREDTYTQFADSGSRRESSFSDPTPNFSKPARNSSQEIERAPQFPVAQQPNSKAPQFPDNFGDQRRPQSSIQVAARKAAEQFDRDTRDTIESTFGSVVSTWVSMPEDQTTLASGTLNQPVQIATLEGIILPSDYPKPSKPRTSFSQPSLTHPSHSKSSKPLPKDTRSHNQPAIREEDETLPVIRPAIGLNRSLTSEASTLQQLSGRVESQPQSTGHTPLDSASMQSAFISVPDLIQPPGAVEFALARTDSDDDKLDLAQTSRNPQSRVQNADHYDSHSSSFPETQLTPTDAAPQLATVFQPVVTPTTTSGKTDNVKHANWRSLWWIVIGCFGAGVGVYLGLRQKQDDSPTPESQEGVTSESIERDHVVAFSNESRDRSQIDEHDRTFRKAA